MSSKHMMKSLLLLVSLQAILACSFAITPAPQVGSLGTLVSATLQALTAAAPAATQAGQPIGIPVSFQNVSFVIPSGLAISASSKVIPNNPTDQNGGPWAVAPQHIEFTLNGYNLPAGYFQEILIDVYPAQEYPKVNDWARVSLQNLQAFLASPAMPATPDTLPLVPYFNAGPLFDARVKVITFKVGSGVRLVTEYGQAAGPATNNATFYNFEGLTSDGKYFLVVVLPIEAPFLLNGNDPSASLPAEGIPFPNFNSPDPALYNNYYKAITDKMNATDSNSFQPSINSLDALVQSISISQ
jgi:hypothetical protein